MSTLHPSTIHVNSNDNNKSLIDSCSNSSNDSDDSSSSSSSSSRRPMIHEPTSSAPHDSSASIRLEEEKNSNSHNHGASNNNTTNAQHSKNDKIACCSPQHWVEKDKEGIALLRVIFPDATQDELEEIHKSRILQSSCGEMMNSISSSSGGSAFAEQEECRKDKGNKRGEQQRRNTQSVDLPEDFLRISPQQALKLPNKYGVMEWNIVANLERQVVMAHCQTDAGVKSSLDHGIVRTAVFSRDGVDLSLGMQLREYEGLIHVNCLLCPGGNRIVDEETYQVAVQSGLEWKEFGPAFVAGVKPGDLILGVNGLPFLRWGGSSTTMLQPHGYGGDGDGRRMEKLSSSKNVLMKAARMIRATGDPIVLHLFRNVNDFGAKGVSATYNNNAADGGVEGQVPKMLAFEAGDDAVVEINGYDDNDTLTTRSELSGSGRDSWNHVDGVRIGTIINQNHNAIHPLMEELMKKGLTKSKREQVHLSRLMYQLTCRAAMWKKNRYLLSGPFKTPLSYLHHDEGKSVLDFIHQALCVHIVNTFVERKRLAYTMYVVDVESKQEWYAPIRFYSDFQDLRAATSRLNKEVEKLPFPNASWFGSGDEMSLSQHMKDTRRRDLESFMRGLCNMVYTSKIDASLYEITLFVQTFLGCDAQLAKPIEAVQSMKANPECDAKARIQEAIQLYTYRLFLMPTFKTLVTRFVDDVRRRALLIEEKKTVNLGSSDLEKKRIILELVTVKHVFMNILDLIQKGCIDDFKAIASSIMDQIDITLDFDTFLDSTIRDAVREQIEIEAYVPCRSIISSMLVHGWRYEDRTIYYKIMHLRQKSQSFFKINPGNQSPSGWSSVIQILRDGVGRNTLPCNKLKAIVNAGKQIGRLLMDEHPSVGKQKSTLGADDFLPIFMYCVVNAELDRPCALCALLKHLCDDIQQIGEVGYYLSSFEATIMYIHDMDLSAT